MPAVGKLPLPAGSLVGKRGLQCCVQAGEAVTRTGYCYGSFRPRPRYELSAGFPASCQGGKVSCRSMPGCGAQAKPRERPGEAYCCWAALRGKLVNVASVSCARHQTQPGPPDKQRKKCTACVDEADCSRRTFESAASQPKIFQLGNGSKQRPGTRSAAAV